MGPAITNRTRALLHGSGPSEGARSYRAPPSGSSPVTGCALGAALRAGLRRVCKGTMGSLTSRELSGTQYLKEDLGGWHARWPHARSRACGQGWHARRGLIEVLGALRSRGYPYARASQGREGLGFPKDLPKRVLKMGFWHKNPDSTPRAGPVENPVQSARGMPVREDSGALTGST